MRILQIGPVPPEVGGRSRGGVATHVWNLSRQLAARNHRVAVLADNCPGANELPDLKDGVEIYGRYPLSRTAQSRRILQANFWRKAYHIKHQFGPLQSWQKIIVGLLYYMQVIGSFQPDVIHVHHLENRFPFAHFSTGDKCPIITTVHSTSYIEFSDPPLKNLRHQFVEQNLQLTHHLIFVSQFVKERYEELFPGSLECRMTRVIHNPIDASVFKLLPKKEARSRIKKDSKPPMILFVGKLIPRKGAHLLVEAVGRLRAKGQSLQLTIVGDGPQKRNLEVLIHEKELISSVFLEGPKSQAELIHYYNAADLFVLPSLMESFGLVFVEALLCGCPVIGTPRVLNELLPSEDYGYYTPPSDTLALADTIEKALSRSWDRAELSDYAFRTFNWEDRIKDFEQVYAEVVTLSS